MSVIHVIANTSALRSPNPGSVRDTSGPVKLACRRCGAEIVFGVDPIEAEADALIERTSRYVCTGGCGIDLPEADVIREAVAS